MFGVCFITCRLCLSGGEKVQYAVLNSIQELGKSFSNFKDEVLVTFKLTYISNGPMAIA